MSDFSGKWHTTFGPMDLAQEGPRVTGVYGPGAECSIEGAVADRRLTFQYQEPAVSGEGWFDLTRTDNAFFGQWRPEGAESWGEWIGERWGFDGLWDTSFGLMRLSQQHDRIVGFYEGAGSSTIEGQVKDNQLVFRYQEPRDHGQGRFELADDGLRFAGEWRPSTEEDWRGWRGRRVLPRPGQTWLVVLEAPWQRFLSDPEYSFGNMLREFFARVEHVEVRHRFFINEAGLQQCCRDLMYLSGPIVLVLATHGLPHGIPVGGSTVEVRKVVESLRYAGDVRLMHFSACLLLQDPALVGSLRALSTSARLAMSGYSTSVNWAASAIIEFTYLEMILNRGMTPAEASAQVIKLLPFAGAEGVPEGAFPPAGFQLILPDIPSRK
jgi:hypothetical protein